MVIGNMVASERIERLTKCREALEKIHDDIYDAFRLSGIIPVLKEGGSIKYRCDYHDIDRDIAVEITSKLSYIFDDIDREIRYIKAEEDAA